MRRPSKLSKSRTSGSRSEARSTPPAAERVSRRGPGDAPHVGRVGERRDGHRDAAVERELGRAVDAARQPLEPHAVEPQLARAAAVDDVRDVRPRAVDAHGVDVGVVGRAELRRGARPRRIASRVN